ncbi:thiamine-phosphate kinase [Sandaracinobacter neustonicus]|nr:thiamine-phosphate kinase [Sandaracinobacter neustonicus]
MLARLKAVARHPAARGLADDAAVLGWPLGQDLVATHDMLAEGVHFTPDCPPADIGWKLAAVNLSDLAAMGARPVGALMGAGIGNARGTDWAAELLRGLMQCLDAYDTPLLGGDTIRSGPTSVLSLTALGQSAPGTALARSGATDADDLWVSGTIGDAGLGLRIAQGGPGASALLKRYRRPTPRLALGLALSGVASAAMDVSDGLLIDAARLAAASGLAADISAAAIPLSPDARASGVPVAELATLGDDYELIFAAPPAARAKIEAAATQARTPICRIGRLHAGAGLTLDGATPAALGYQHR